MNFMIRSVGLQEIRMPNRLLLGKGKKSGLVNSKLSLPAGKELKPEFSEQSKRAKILASSKCSSSEYEPVDYCSPLFP